MLSAPTPTSQPPGYRSYLLRVWQERGEQATNIAWRFSLEDPLSGQRYGFASLEALNHWLEIELAHLEQLSNYHS